MFTVLFVSGKPQKLVPGASRVQLEIICLVGQVFDKYALTQWLLEDIEALIAFKLVNVRKVYVVNEPCLCWKLLLSEIKNTKIITDRK